MLTDPETAIPDAYRLVPDAVYLRMVAVLRAVAKTDPDPHDYRCPYCGSGDHYPNEAHAPDCPVTVARALVAEMEEDA